MENELEVQDSLNTDGKVESETSTEESETSTDNSEELAKMTKDYESQKIRAEKAERENKELKSKLKPIQQEVAPKNEPMISLKDTKALMDVHDDDIDKLVGWAKFNNISIAEAKKTPEMQSYLKSQEELRKSAEATNTGSANRRTSVVSEDVLLEQVEKGILPEEDIEKAVKARLEQKKKRT